MSRNVLLFVWRILVILACVWTLGTIEYFLNWR